MAHAVTSRLRFARVPSAAGVLCVAGLAACSQALSPTSRQSTHVDTPDAGDRALGSRPLAPLSTATVSSQRPALRWMLGAGLDGAVVELCRERACTTVLERLEVTGSSAAPTRALAPGVVFWRVRGTRGGSAVADFGPTWEFFVGARDAAVNTSWGTTLDVNGDGLADLAVGAPTSNSGRGGVYVYLGTASGFAATPSSTLVGSGVSSSVAVASAGDVNGDGFGDLAVGSSNGSFGSMAVFFGSPTGIDGSRLAFEDAPGWTGGYGGSFGSSVAGVGDTNGDGYADVLVGCPRVNDRLGAAFLYLGGPSELTDGRGLFAPQFDDGDFGASVASAGDTDGDGFEDFVVGSPHANHDQGRAYVYPGHGAARYALEGPTPGALFGSSVVNAGDTNGDGLTDLAVGAPLDGPGGSARLYLGTSAGTPTTAALSLAGTGAFGSSVAGAGDTNGDGYADLAVGAPLDGPGGSVHVYLGGPSSLGTTPAQSLRGSDAGGGFGASIALVGDTDGDGFSELVVGAPSASSGSGNALVFRGGPEGFGVSPATTLYGPENFTGSFGAAVALSRRPRWRLPTPRALPGARG